MHIPLAMWAGTYIGGISGVHDTFSSDSALVSYVYQRSCYNSLGFYQINLSFFLL